MVVVEYSFCPSCRAAFFKKGKMNPESQAFGASELATDTHGEELISSRTHDINLRDLSSSATEVVLSVIRAVRKLFPFPRLSKLISFSDMLIHAKLSPISDHDPNRSCFGSFLTCLTQSKKHCFLQSPELGSERGIPKMHVLLGIGVPPPFYRTSGAAMWLLLGRPTRW
jgi:hypothetical protein